MQNYHYRSPPGRPQRKWLYCGSVAAACLFSDVVYSIGHDHRLLGVTIISGFLMAISCHLINRFSFLLQGRITQETSTNAICKDVFSFTTGSRVVIAFVLIMTVLLRNDFNPSESAKLLGLRPFVSSFVAAFLICEMTSMYQCHAWEDLMMDHMRGLDVANFMAQSVFFGYISLFLPGLRENIELYMEKKGIADEKFPVKKMILLVPSSGNCPSKLEDCLEGCDVESCDTLEFPMRDRAGAARRAYRGAIYRFRVSEDPLCHVFCMVEFPAVVQTFSESIQKGRLCAKHVKAHQSGIIRRFSAALQTLIHDEMLCRGRAKVIYFNDDQGLEHSGIVGVLKEYLLRKQEEKIRRHLR